MVRCGILMNVWYPQACLGDRLMVGQQPLKLYVGVRVPIPEPKPYRLFAKHILMYKCLFCVLVKDEYKYNV